MYDIRKHWTAVSTLLCLISSVYHDLHHRRLNQWPQIAEPKLYNWANSRYLTQLTRGADHGRHCWWDLIRLKRLSSVSICCVKVFARSSGHGNSIHNIIPLLKKEKYITILYINNLLIIIQSQVFLSNTNNL